MATEIVHTIKASGGDYSSLSAWEAAQERDLVSADEIAVAECYAFEDTAQVTITGAWVTDTTRYIEIRPASGAHARLPWSTDAYRLVAIGFNAALEIQESNVNVKNIQIENIRSDLTDGGSAALSFIGGASPGSGSVIIDGCLGRRNPVNLTRSPGSAPIFFLGNANSQSISMKNCVSIGHRSGIEYNNNGTISSSVYILNNTVIGATQYGFSCANLYGTEDTFVLRNNLATGSGTADYAFEATANVLDIRTHNASGDATAPATSASINQTFQFVDAANGDYRLSQTDTGARTKGIDLSTASYGFTNDFLNQTRLTPWDIGATETGIYQNIKTIKSASGDYTSLSAWEGAQQGDLIASKSIAIAECYPFEDTTPLTVSGWTTGLNSYIYIRTPEQHRPQYMWDTGSYRLSISDTNNFGADYFILDGIQVKGNYSTNLLRTAININGTETGLAIVRNCNIVGNFQSYPCTGIYIHKGSAPGNQIVYIYNNVIYNWTNPDKLPWAYGSSSTAIFGNQYGQQHIYNNTMISCSMGMRASSVASTVTASNNLMYLCETASFGTFDVAFNNATDSSSVVGTNSYVNQTFNFVDYDGGNFRLSTFDNGARGKGTTIDTNIFSTDFDGIRRRRAWDIGAFQNNEQQIKINPNGTNQISGVGVTTFIDEFNRANGPIGSNYQTSSFSGGVYNTGSFVIVSNSVNVPGNGPYFATVSQSFSDDHESTVRYTVINDFDFAGPLVRGNVLNGTGYTLYLDGENLNNRTIQKLLTGSRVLTDGLGIGTVNITVSAGDVVTLRAVGNTISAYKNGVLVDSVTDTDYPTGSAGMFYDKGNLTATKVDNLIVTDIPPQGKTGQLMTITPT